MYRLVVLFCWDRCRVLATAHDMHDMAQGSFLSQEYAVKFIRDNPGLRKATEILS